MADLRPEDTRMAQKNTPSRMGDETGRTREAGVERRRLLGVPPASFLHIFYRIRDRCSTLSVEYHNRPLNDGSADCKNHGDPAGPPRWRRPGQPRHWGDPRVQVRERHPCLRNEAPEAERPPATYMSTSSRPHRSLPGPPSPRNSVACQAQTAPVRSHSASSSRAVATASTTPMRAGSRIPIPE